MIEPSNMPANNRDQGIVTIEITKILEMGTPLPMITTRAMQVNILVNELLRELPDADFIEIKAVRYTAKEGNDERSTQPAPDA